MEILLPSLPSHGPFHYHHDGGITSFTAFTWTFSLPPWWRYCFLHCLHMDLFITTMMEVLLPSLPSHGPFHYHHDGGIASFTTFMEVFITTMMEVLLPSLPSHGPFHYHHDGGIASFTAFTWTFSLPPWWRYCFLHYLHGSFHYHPDGGIASFTAFTWTFSLSPWWRYCFLHCLHMDLFITTMMEVLLPSLPSWKFSLPLSLVQGN